MEHIRIDEKLIIHIPESLKTIPQYNHNVQTYTIDCPRYTQNGEDMLEMVPFISVEKKGEKEPVAASCSSPIPDETDENIIHFDWTIRREVTDTVGKIGIVVCVRRSEEENLENAWHTFRNEEIEIKKGIDCGLDMMMQYPGLIEELLYRLGIVEKSGGAVPDKTLTISGAPADSKVTGDKFRQLSATVNDMKENGTGTGTVVSSVEPMEDDIPKIFLTGVLPVTKTETIMRFVYVSKTLTITGYVVIKCQGSSSMNYEKKNFTIKVYLDKECTVKLKTDFKGWGKQNKFVLKANWIDITHARNIVNARLWGQIVKSRSDYNTLPEELRTSPNQGAVDGFPVKLYSNGVYQGRYTLNIPKDGWMANMDDELETHCIISGNGYNGACFRSVSSVGIDAGEWQDELHDTVPTTINTRWLEVQDFVMNSTDEDFVNNFENYFDKQSVIDYFVFAVTHVGLDAFGKNQMYFTYNGVKFYASMYDMDSTWCLWWNGSKFVEATYPRISFQDYLERSENKGNLLYVRLVNLMNEDIKTRYNELRQSVLHVDNIICEFEKFTDITSSELVKEDYASTTANGKFTGIPNKTANNIRQIRQAIVDRLAYCDSYFATLTGTVECTGISLNVDTLTFNTAESQTLVATITPNGCTDVVTWQSLDESVCTVNNGVVTPIYDGTTTVTVSCGNYSDVCDVTVEGVAVNTNAKYPLKSGTYTPSDVYEVSVSGGNHVRFTSNDNACHNSNFVNLRDISQGKTISTDLWFSLKNGDVVTLNLPNVVYGESNTFAGAISTAMLNTSGGTIKEVNIGKTSTFTISEDIDVACLRMWNAGPNGAIVDIEFDIELTVNDVRYI